LLLCRGGDTRVPKGFSKSNLQCARKRFGLQGLVEIHHVIPKQFSRHNTVIREQYDTEASYNFLFCPTKKGKFFLNIRPDRLLHSNGHIEYNRYVHDKLETCFTPFDFISLLILLHMICRGLFSIHKE